MSGHFVVSREGTPVKCFEREVHAANHVSGALIADAKAYEDAEAFLAAADTLPRDEDGNVQLTEEFSQKYSVVNLEQLEERIALANATEPSDEADYTITEV